MAQSTNVLTATITATDANGNTSVNRGIGSPTLAGVFGEFVISQGVTVGTTVLVTGNLYNVYVKNAAAPGSGITLTVSLTRQADAVTITTNPLQPGGVLIEWNVVNNVLASSYTTIAVTAAGGTCPIEYFFGA